MATLIGIQYVGKKDRPQPDTVAGTSLVWSDREQVHYVSESVAIRLLKHPDVWKESGRKTGKDEPAQAVDTQSKQQPEPLLPPLVQLDAMDRQAMVTYALSHFGQKLPSNMTEANMRQRIRNWMNSPLATE